MWAIFRRTIKNHWKSLVAFSLIVVLLLFVFAAMYPELQGQAEEFSELIKLYPESFINAFGVETESMFSSIEGFLAAEHYSLMWQLMAAIFAIGLGVNTVAKEVDEGTVEVLLAQPVSRVKILLAKVLAGATLITVYTAVSVFSVIPFLKIYDIDYSFESHRNIAILGVLFGLTIYAFTVLLSSISSSSGLVTSISAGTLVIMYTANIVAKLKEDLDGVKWMSFFHYFDANTAMLRKELDSTSIIVFLAVTIVCILAAFALFKKRDVAV